MEIIWFWVGGIAAVLCISLAADAIAGKTPWRQFAIDAAIIAAIFAGFGALLHLGVSWLTQTPLGWLLFFGFILAGLFVRAMVGALRLIVDLLGGR